MNGKRIFNNDGDLGRVVLEAINLFTKTMLFKSIVKIHHSAGDIHNYQVKIFADTSSEKYIDTNFARLNIAHLNEAFWNDLESVLNAFELSEYVVLNKKLGEIHVNYLGEGQKSWMK